MDKYVYYGGGTGKLLKNLIYVNFFIFLLYYFSIGTLLLKSMV